MVNVCSVCRHPQRRQIDTLLVTRSGSMRDIAGQFEVSKSALARHRKTCLPALLAKAHDAERVQSADLLATAQALMAKAVGILNEAERRRDWSTALRGIAESRNCLTLLAEMRGELNRQPTVNMLIASPAWIELRGALVQVLVRHPEVRDEVIEVFSRLEDGNATF